VRDLNSDQAVSGIVLKTCTLNAKEGKPWPNFVMKDYYAINNMGLPNNGFVYYSRMHEIYCNKPVILSIDGSITTDVILMLKSYSDIISNIPREHEQTGGIVEINVSCPNLGNQSKPIAISKRLLSEFLHQVFDQKFYTNLSIGLKLPPYFYEYKIKEIAEVINYYPIKFITCSNTIPNALNMMPEVHGGLSGMMNKPIALANVKLFRKYLHPQIEIIGCGGIEQAQDVSDYLQCGAKLVQIGTGYIKNKNVFQEIAAKL